MPLFFGWILPYISLPSSMAISWSYVRSYFWLLWKRKWLPSLFSFCLKRRTFLSFASISLVPLGSLRFPCRFCHNFFCKIFANFSQTFLQIICKLFVKHFKKCLVQNILQNFCKLGSTRLNSAQPGSFLWFP